MTLQIKRSTIDNVGFGVFANRNIKALELITKYDGKEFNEGGERYGLTTWETYVEDIDKLTDDDICFLITHQNYKVNKGDKQLYGYNFNELLQKHKKDINKYCGSLINHNEDNNCMIGGWNGKDVIQATRDILKGEELFNNYGSNYWRTHKEFEEANLEWKMRTPKSESIIEVFTRYRKEKEPVKGFILLLNKH